MRRARETCCPLWQAPGRVGNEDLVRTAGRWWVSSRNRGRTGAVMKAASQWDCRRLI